MEVRPGYKQTEIGVIPTDWGCERIGDAAATSANAIVGGPFGSDLVSSDYVPVGVPVIRGQNMSAPTVSGDFVFVTPQKAKALRANLAYPGDVIFTQRGTLGQVSVVPDGGFERYLVSQSQMKVSLDRLRHDSNFVYQFFASREGQAQILASAIQTGVPHTNLGILRAYKFPAPPLIEQRAIAQALNDVDVLLGGVEQLIAKKRLIKEGAMQELLTASKRLPGFGGPWMSVSLQDVAEVRTGPFGTALHERDYVAEGTPIITVEHLGERGIVHADLPMVSVVDRARLQTYSLAMGDIVFSRVGAIDRNALVTSAENGWLFSGRLLRVRPRPTRVSSAYLSYYFHGEEFKARIRTVVVGQTMASLNTRLLQDVEVAFPSLDEQVAIAAVLSDMDAEIDALEQRLTKTRAIKEGMMQALLTGRIRLVPPQGTPAAA